MASSSTLGGFKVLKDVLRFSVDTSSSAAAPSPAALCRDIREEKVNLPYITCICDDTVWRMTLAVDAEDDFQMNDILRLRFGETFSSRSGCVVLSVFPHRDDPAITGTLLEVLGLQGVEVDALASSPSAISVVLKESSLNRASAALFKAFRFSAYRTPEDWKLAQKGKERLYKEVVASYQEQRPKVYGLDYRDGQQLLCTSVRSADVPTFGVALKSIAGLGLDLAFLTTTPADEEDRTNLYFCLPESQIHTYKEILRREAPAAHIQDLCAVGTFSMTGPHFGDRYGIASELLTMFEKRGVEFLGLNCTVASIRAAVPADHVHSALAAVQECFEVPTVTRKN